MNETADIAQVIIRPPLAWGLVVIAGLALNWLVPLPFLPADLPAGGLGAMVFVIALVLFAWAIVTITRAGSNVPSKLPTTTIVENGPYRFTRNPIYLGMFLGLVGLAIAFDNFWLLMMLVPFALVIRYGVVARARKPISSANSAMSTVATARAYGAGYRLHVRFSNRPSWCAHHPVFRNPKREGGFCGHFSRVVVSDFRSLRGDIAFRPLLVRQSPAAKTRFQTRNGQADRRRARGARGMGTAIG